jgi:hypothetical protein
MCCERLTQQVLPCRCFCPIDVAVDCGIHDGDVNSIENHKTFSPLLAASRHFSIGQPFPSSLPVPLVTRNFKTALVH